MTHFRTFLFSTLSLFVATGLTATVLTTTGLAAQTADTIFLNAAVHTMDPDTPRAEAVAVAGDEILFIGTSIDAAAFQGDGTEVIDLEGKMVLPGFVDAHMHAFAGGLIMQGVDLQSDDADEVLAMAEKWINETKEPVVHGFGVRFTPWKDGNPTAAMLDQFETERPVYFWTISGHGAWVNSKALEVAGIDKDSPEPAPGFSFYERDDEGNPTGWVVEIPAQMEVLTRILDISPEYILSGVEEWFPRFSAAGITATQDLGIQGVSQETGFAMLDELAKSGEMPMRLRGVYYWNDGDIDPVAEIQKLTAKFAHPMARPEKIKINIDGGDDSDNALFIDGYASDPDLDPDPIIPRDTIIDAVVRADSLGIDAVCHCFGDGAVRIMLDAVEAAIATNPPRDRRFVVSHGMSVHADDTARFGELGVVWDSSGAWMSYDPTYQAVTNVKLGPERTQEMVPMARVARAGGMVSLGSDWPVSGWVSEYRPLVAIETAMTRTIDGRKDVPPLGGPEARVDLDTALRAATITAAYNMRMEDQIGSLKVGKKADIVVLESDLYDIAPDDISEVRVLGTMMGGTFMHRDGI